MSQDYHQAPSGQRAYSFASGDADGQPPDRDNLPRTLLRVDKASNDAAGAWIGGAMDADGINLTKPGGFQANGDIPLNQTVGQWDAPPFFAQLQLQTDSASNTVFRLCWHLRLPSIIRLSCGKFDRLTGEFRGVHIVDDSAGLGALTWSTQ